ncbi:MAG: 4Fe-4S dicluster domain-containing protein [Deferribacteres bacterium]|nr:4Fe-4S dicluster domain-containing protein [candidate division KSB1 bacterium]MCB9500399.1 4Fe-4S dicluster domain-containing protein [Deferribacteres bacterium]
MKWLIQLIEELAEIRSPLRPPGAVHEEEFINRCIRCNKCIQICPYHSIIAAPLSHGKKVSLPVIVPKDIPCYVCMKCPPVCPTGALDNTLVNKQNVAMGLAVINEDLCLPYNGIICRACFERCPIYREAITLKDELYPQVHTDKCTGCGVCESVCPAEETAITIKSNHKIFV